MGVKKFQQISSASLFLSISGILIVFLAPLCEPCPYYCTCSKTVNTCSGFSGQLPNAQLMNSDSYPTEQWPNEPNPEISSSWDFSHGNNITTLDADTFKGLSSITHLWVLHHPDIKVTGSFLFRPQQPQYANISSKWISNFIPCCSLLKKPKML